MTLQSSGQIRASEIRDEFEGATEISMSDYYSGGQYVPSSANVPSSGELEISDYYGESNLEVQTPNVEARQDSGVPDQSSWARINWSNDGEIHQDTDDGVGYPQQDTWLLAGNPGDFEIRIIRTSGDTLTQGESKLGNWLSLSNNHQIEVEADFNAGPTSAGADGEYQIRSAGDGTIMGSGTWSLFTTTGEPI